MQRDFKADVTTVGLILTTYQLVVACLLLSFGRVGDLRGRRPVFLIGFAAFVAASALCALAPSVGLLIAFRTVQAVGAAMFFANAIAIVTSAFPARERGRAIGTLSIITYTGLSVGPPLAGLINDTFGWRSVFGFNVVAGVVLFAVAWRVVPRDRAARAAGRFDLAGALLFACTLTALFFGLQEGPRAGWLSPQVDVALLASIVLGVAFVAVEHRGASPMLDLALFRRRSFSAASASGLANYCCTGTVYVLMPFYLIQGRGFAPTVTGFALSVLAVTQVVVAPLAGALSDRIGTRRPRTFGQAVLTAGVLALAQLGPATPLPLVLVVLAVIGVGTGAFVSPNTSQLLGAVPPVRRGIASAMVGTARYLGFAVGAAVAAGALASVGAATDTAAALGATGPAFLIAASFGAIGIVASALPDDAAATVGSGESR